MTPTRRDFIAASVAGSSLVIAGLNSSTSVAAEQKKKVSANEDLMREHGVLRRALLVYGAAAERLTRHPGSFPASALARTARLFREFGEDYHERRLEEQIIFPAVRKLKGAVARYPDVLALQHDRGRELTDYVIRVTQGGNIGSSHASALAGALRKFNLMYEHHAAREDTEVFTAWKDAMPSRDYEDMGERFESIEKQVFGHDGFEEALKTIAHIEEEMGLSDLARFTIPRLPL